MDIKSRGSWLRYLLPLLLFILLARIHGLDRFSLSRDELASAAWAMAHSWSSLARMLYDIFEGNAFGYPVFVRLWGQLSLSELWLRLPSVFASAAIVFLFCHRQDRVRGLGRVSVCWAALLLSLSVGFFLYSRVARGYALYALFAYLALVCHEDFISRRRTRYLFGHVIAGALSVYLHYFGFFYLAALWVSVPIREYRDDKRLLLAPLAVACLFLPHFPLFLFQLGHGPLWIDPVDASVLLGSLRFHFGQPHFGATVVAAVFFLLGMVRAQRHELLWTFFPPFVAVILGFFFRPIYGDRFFLPSTIGAFIMVAGGMNVVFAKNRAFRVIGLMAALVTTAFSLVELTNHYREPTAVDYREAARAIVANAAECGSDVEMSPAMVQRMPYYLRGFTLHNWESSQAEKPYWLFVEEGYPEPAYLRAVSQDQGRKVWSSHYLSVFCVKD